MSIENLYAVTVSCWVLILRLEERNLFLRPPRAVQERAMSIYRGGNLAIWHLQHSRHLLAESCSLSQRQPARMQLWNRPRDECSLSHGTPATTFVLPELFSMLPNPYNSCLQRLVLTIIVIVLVHFHRLSPPLRYPLCRAVALAQILDRDLSL